ncbi:MAG: glycosyltransferase, partial [Planctomycetota bacterium]
MHVVHYIHEIDLALGGVVRCVLDLASLMRARGQQITVLTHDAKDAPPSWSERGIEVVELGRYGSALSRLSQPQLNAATAAIRRADVLHMHGIWHPSNDQLARLARRLGKPYVISAHGMLDDWSMQQKHLKKKLFLGLGASKTLHRAASIHCTATNELAQAKKWFEPARGEVAPLVFDLEPYREPPGPGPAREAFPEAFETGDPVVLFLSRLHYKKGPDVFIRAMGELGRIGIPFSAVLAGTGDDGYVHELRQLAKVEGVADRCHFVGLVTGALKTSLYQASSVFALPTSQENFGFVFPEAMACGTPVITTTGVDTHPELRESGGAVIVDRDPHAFADAVVQLLGHPEQIEKMGRAGRSWVFDFLEPEAVARAFDALYAR